MKNQKIKGNKNVLLINNVLIILIFLSLLFTISNSVVYHIYKISDIKYSVYGLLSLFIMIYFSLLIGNSISTINIETKSYIKNIKSKISDNYDLNELINIYNDFHDEVTDEKNFIRLPFKQDIKDIFDELDIKIKTIKNIQNK